MSRAELRAHEACPHNKDVRCPWRLYCPTCGWNPEVAANRAAAVRAKLNGRSADDGGSQEKSGSAAADGAEGN